MVQSSNKLPEAKQTKSQNDLNFETDSLSHLQNVGTAKVRTISSTLSTQKKQAKPSRKTYRPESAMRSKRSENQSKKSENLTDPSYVPIDLSNFSKPSRLDIVLPEYIVDYVESLAPHQQQTSNLSDVVSEAIQTEQNRAAEHKEIEVDIKKAVEAMKELEKSYEFLYEQIEATKQLYPNDDVTRKTLDEIVANAATPSSILKGTELPTNSNKN